MRKLLLIMTSVDAIKEGFKKIKYEAQEVKPEEKKDGD